MVNFLTELDTTPVFILQKNPKTPEWGQVKVSTLDKHPMFYIIRVLSSLGIYKSIEYYYFRNIC
jgi:hypothetical protein